MSFTLSFHFLRRNEKKRRHRFYFFTFFKLQSFAIKAFEYNTQSQTTPRHPVGLIFLPLITEGVSNLITWNVKSPFLSRCYLWRLMFLMVGFQARNQTLANDQFQYHLSFNGVLRRSIFIRFIANFRIYQTAPKKTIIFRST